MGAFKSKDPKSSMYQTRNSRIDRISNNCANIIRYSNYDRVRRGTIFPTMLFLCKMVLSGILSIRRIGMPSGWKSMSTENEHLSLLVSLGLLVICGSLFLTLFLPPYLASHSGSLVAAFIYLAFSSVCHQMPARSFWAWGSPLAVCQRCTGIYFGMLLFSILTLVRPCLFLNQRPIRYLVVVASLPLALDAMLPHLGLWTSTPLTRFLSGVLFGSMLLMLLRLAALQFLEQALIDKRVFQNDIKKGGFEWTRNEC
jgi:uncharacterized membrane protein